MTAMRGSTEGRRRGPRHTLAVIAVLAAAMTGLGACSSGGSDASTRSGAHGAEASTSTATTPAPTEAGDDGSGAGGGDIQTYCAHASTNTLLQNLGANPATTDMKAVVADTQQALDIAPSEIKPDLEAMLKYFQALNRGDVGAASAQQATMQDAIKHYVGWVGQHCAGVGGGLAVP